MVLAATAVGLLAGAGALHALARIAPALGDRLARAPWVDGLLFFFTALPWFPGAALAGWSGLLGAVGGQLAALLAWVALHELAHARGPSRPRIHRTLDRLVGRPRNHFALWWTIWAVPTFWTIRLTQWIVYPVLVRTIRLPRYAQGDWVNLSRHKFRGLVGYDLIWCLYCDWMTGVWSLGSEMLRNLESFWCPIRFDNPEKCANCARDFPDLDGGWVRADGDMAQVAALLEEKYGGDRPVNPWYGHPARLTVKGEPTGADDA